MHVLHHSPVAQNKCLNLIKYLLETSKFTALNCYISKVSHIKPKTLQKQMQAWVILLHLKKVWKSVKSGPETTGQVLYGLMAALLNNNTQSWEVLWRDK